MFAVIYRHCPPLIAIGICPGNLRGYLVKDRRPPGLGLESVMSPAEADEIVRLGATCSTETTCRRPRDNVVQIASAGGNPAPWEPTRAITQPDEVLDPGRWTIGNRGRRHGGTRFRINQHAGQSGVEPIKQPAQHLGLDDADAFDLNAARISPKGLVRRGPNIGGVTFRGVNVGCLCVCHATDDALIIRRTWRDSTCPGFNWPNECTPAS
ncbi:MAG: hypothetical protein WBG36_04895 [Ornithinimicrobium sp.]